MGMLESMSWSDMIVADGIASAVVALLMLRAARRRARLGVSFVFPFAFATCLYWIPATLSGGSQAEYSTWAAFFLVPATTAGLPSAAFIVLCGALFRKHRARNPKASAA
jgi:hypothetical protein